MNNGNPPDLAVERLEKIRRTLKASGVVRVDDLSREFGVSPATIRRDLRSLESDGQASRVHGGAVLSGGRLDEPLFEDKQEIAAGEKGRIAAAARDLIEPEECVFLDGGSTVLALARLLRAMRSLTVVTNSLRVAAILSEGGPRLILVGGELRRRSQTFVGALTQPVIERLHVDKAFMGTIGLAMLEGLTTTDPAEAMTKQLMMSHAGVVVLLADSGKIGKVAFARAGSMDDVDVLITDKGAPAAFLREARKSRTRVVTV